MQYPEDSREYIIYVLTSPSGKQYIGQTCQKMRERWNKHKSDAKTHANSEIVLIKAINKYGANSFKMELVERGLCVANIDDRERYWIKEKNTLVPNGYNMTPGGQDGLHRLKCVGDPEETASMVDRAALPLYINFMYCKRGYHSYIVRDLSNKLQMPQKAFRSGTKSLEQCLELAKAYLRKYLPEDKWVYEQKTSVTRTIDRELIIREEVLRSLDIEKIPKYTELKKTVQNKWYIAIRDAQNPARFTTKTFYPNNERSLRQCLDESQQYLDQYISRKEREEKKDTKTTIILREIGLEQLPKGLYFGETKKTVFVGVKDTRRVQRFPRKSFYVSEDKSYLDCIKEAQEYIDSFDLKE